MIEPVRRVKCAVLRGDEFYLGARVREPRCRPDTLGRETAHGTSFKEYSCLYPRGCLLFQNFGQMRACKFIDVDVYRPFCRGNGVGEHLIGTVGRDKRGNRNSVERPRRKIRLTDIIRAYVPDSGGGVEFMHAPLALFERVGGVDYLLHGDAVYDEFKVVAAVAHLETAGSDRVPDRRRRVVYLIIGVVSVDIEEGGTLACDRDRARKRCALRESDASFAVGDQNSAEASAAAEDEILIPLALKVGVGAELGYSDIRCRRCRRGPAHAEH